jgi:hypothetical protein
MEQMRGPDGFTESMFTVLKLDDFVPKDHPLRPIRTWLNDALKRMPANVLRVSKVRPPASVVMHPNASTTDISAAC